MVAAITISFKYKAPHQITAVQKLFHSIIATVGNLPVNFRYIRSLSVTSIQPEEVLHLCSDNTFLNSLAML
jgi:hypothetical protein